MFKKYANILTKKGYTFYPVAMFSKMPAKGIKWKTYKYTPECDDDIYGRCGVALIAGGVNNIIGLDFDIMDEDIINNIKKMFPENFPWRTGQYPKTLFIAKTEKPIKKITSKIYDIKGSAGRLEILAQGQSFIWSGLHPVTRKPYTHSEIPHVSQLPFIPVSKLYEIVKYTEFLCGKKYTEKKNNLALEYTNEVSQDYDSDLEELKTGLTDSEIENILEHIDPDCSRAMWINIGMAVHMETDGLGFHLWDEFSARGEKYKPNECRIQWDSFDRENYSGRKITGKFLRKLEKMAGVKNKREPSLSIEPSSVFSFSEFDERLTPELYPMNPPPLPMLIDGVLPSGIVSTLYSMGGVGKSTFSLQLAIEIALCNALPNFKTLFGVTCSKSGSVYIITAEEPQRILQLRISAMIKGIADKLVCDPEEIRNLIIDKIYIKSTYGHNVQFFKIGAGDILEPTKNYQNFIDRIKKIPDLKLIIVDTKSRFSIAEGKGNTVASQEVSLFEKLVLETINLENPEGANVILLHHTSKSSRSGKTSASNAYRDASGFYDALRAGWFLRNLDEKEEALITKEEGYNYIMLEHSKHNYTARNEPIVLKRKGNVLSFHATFKKLDKQDEKEIKADKAIKVILNALNIKSRNKSEIVNECKIHNLSRTVTLEAIKNCLGLDLLIENSGKGTSKILSITEAGKNEIFNKKPL